MVDDGRTVIVTDDRTSLSLQTWMDGSMPYMVSSLRRVPPGDAAEVTIVNRRTGSEQTQTVAPFEISATVVTVEAWNAVAAGPARP